ncbi:hypothetical protein QAD02_020524 [Eretmocerus hayati]|uniref:Uncharacterized protein n=1 Tax=Eretmocerus hayati TaxID=131215 RepID=A0ACC2PPJ6_9HYME|nr:hypothetical protein QAD02_020524 [Eretmocerus hayati]
MGTIDDARKAFLTDQRSDKPTKYIGDIDQDTINVEQTGLVRNTSREIVSNKSVMPREDVGLDVVCAESDVASHVCVVATKEQGTQTCVAISSAIADDNNLSFLRSSKPHGDDYSTDQLAGGIYLLLPLTFR